MSSRFFTNSDQNSLFDKFTGILAHMRDIHAFHAVVGYFRSSGYFALQPHLKDLKSIRILVGINVDSLFAEAQRKGQFFFGDESKTRERFIDDFIKDIQEARYEKSVEDGIIQFIHDLTSGRIEVRAHKSQAIHAKFYLFLPEHHSEHSDGWVIMGSSNLTEAGLGIHKSPNYEMNIALKDYQDVKFAAGEFEKLWAQGTPVLPADIKAARQQTHIGQTFTPFELYLKLLIEYFGKFIEYDPDTVGDLPRTYRKLSYQVDAVNQGFQMLLEHNGFFLADVVGLGKTIVAAMVAKRFLASNGSLNTKILVVYPPALEKNWKNTFRQFGIDRHTKFITNGRLEKILEGSDLNYWPKEEYDLILVDEAHRFRNHTSRMFGNLQRICKAPRANQGLVPGNKKKIVLISATPLNNRPQDLKHLLLLFQDERRSTLPETNLTRFFGPIVKEYEEIMRQDRPDLQRIRELYRSIRERVIAPITVRRTRKDLDKYPRYKDDLIAQGIVFPDLAPPRPKIYQLSPKVSKLFYHSVFLLTDTDKVNYFRYQAIKFLKDDLQKQYYDNANRVSESLAGIMKTLMVKRLESSFHAFRISLRNLLVATQRMIHMFEVGKVLVAPDLRVNDLMEAGASIDEIEELILEKQAENPRNNVFAPDDFDPALLEGLHKDAAILSGLLADWEKVEGDPKLQTFLDTLDADLLHPSINPSGKLVIFTESTDTAHYLKGKLHEQLGRDILTVSSDNRSKVFEVIQENFDANFPGTRKDNHSILITTDVLAEGINLHRANVIINYDTPWNATRLMQRIGRVNRIGSEAGVIYNYSFYPSQQGDEEIKLYRNALLKLQSFHSAFGEDAQIYTHEELVEQFELFKEGNGTRDDEDRRLEHLEFIRSYAEQHPIEFKRIKAMPLKARTGRSVSAAAKGRTSESLVFLKSPYKSEFYRVDAQHKVAELTFLEAADLFQAQPAEPAFPIPEVHYTQVSATVQNFEQTFFGKASSTAAELDKSEAPATRSRKYLRDLRAVSSPEVREACTQLIAIVEEGTFTQLPLELRRIKQRHEKRSITKAQVDQLILALARQYHPGGNGIADTAAPDFTISPQVILSETFID